MARSFNGTSDFMKTASALNTLSDKNRLAIGFWVQSTFLNDDDLLLELTSNAFSNPGAFAIVADPSGSSVASWFVLHGDNLSSKQLQSKLSNNTWHHILFNLCWSNPGGSVSEVESIFVDGVQALTVDADTNDNTTNTFANAVLYLMSRAGTSLFAEGGMADLCIWAPNSTLGATEAAALYAGSRAWKIRQTEIIHYWPIQGTASPEPAGIGSINLTVGGTALMTDPASLEAYSGVTPPAAEALSLSVLRTSDTTALVDWGTTPADAPNGISILRINGQATTDGNGKSLGDAQYDPSTIPGSYLIASGITVTPYTDSTLDAGSTYTYCIVRTGS